MLTFVIAAAVVKKKSKQIPGLLSERPDKLCPEPRAGDGKAIRCQFAHLAGHAARDQHRRVGHEPGGSPRRQPPSLEVNLMTEPLPISEPVHPLPPLEQPPSVLAWNIVALLVALTAVVGSLWLSLGMELRACPLCFYQRSFVMAAAALLLMALFTESRGSASVSVLALPLAAAGLGVAGFHVFLEASGRLECPHGLSGRLTAPQESLAAHLLLFLILGLASIRRPTMVLGLLLGSLIAWGSVVSAPKLPPVPLKPYPPDPIDTCRPPYRATQ
jgi:disulfide bond formation protein DsbB